MKLLIGLLLIGYSCIYGIAQERYSVYKYTEGVKYLTPQKDWEKLSRKQPVSLMDMLLIPEEGNVAIIDTKTNVLYRSTKNGTIRVKKLIDDAIKQSTNITNKLNETIFENLKESDNKKHSYAVLGAVYRGNNGSVNDVYVALRHFLDKKDSEKQNLHLNDSCSLSRCKLNDEEFYFSIHNSSSNVYYINVLCISETAVTFCFRTPNTQSPLMIGPQETIDFTQYVFSDIANSHKYLLVANIDNLKVSEIEMMLNNNIKAEGETSSTVIITPEIQ